MVNSKAGAMLGVPNSSAVFIDPGVVAVADDGDGKDGMDNLRKTVLSEGRFGLRTRGKSGLDMDIDIRDRKDPGVDGVLGNGKVVEVADCDGVSGTGRSSAAIVITEGLPDSDLGFSNDERVDNMGRGEGGSSSVAEVDADEFAEEDTGDGGEVASDKGAGGMIGVTAGVTAGVSNADTYDAVSSCDSISYAEGTRNDCSSFKGCKVEESAVGGSALDALSRYRVGTGPRRTPGLGRGPPARADNPMLALFSALSSALTSLSSSNMTATEGGGIGGKSSLSGASELVWAVAWIFVVGTLSSSMGC